MELKPWLVFVHIASVMVFLLIHGASAIVAFRLRRERDPERVRALLEMSRDTIEGATGWVLGGALLLLVATGIALGFMGGWWGQAWIWISIVLLVLVVGAMTPMAAMRMRRVRTAISPEPGQEAAPQEAERLLEAWNPVPVATLGVLGLLAILWLMLFKPL